MSFPQDVFQLAGKTVASYGISTTDVATAAVIIVMGYLLNKASNLAVQRAIDRRGGGEHAVKSAKRVTGYVIYPLTIVAVLAALGLPLAGLGAAVGLIGLGISFALKDMIANFLSGVLILVNRPFKIGDQIKVAGEEGTLKDIKLRASEVKTYDGRKVIVPNSDLYNKVVINNTGYDERRFDVVVGIGYDEDVKKARDLAFEALEEAEGVETEPEPEVLVDELGASSVNLKLRGWTKPSRANMVQATSEVTELVKRKFDGEGIEIPYPIRTILMPDRK
ncbi:MAG: mechanosensitive ion channel family protein [Candidatus Nanohaloarchaea archaeon]